MTFNLTRSRRVEDNHWKHNKIVLPRHKAIDPADRLSLVARHKA